MPPYAMAATGHAPRRRGRAQDLRGGLAERGWRHLGARLAGVRGGRRLGAPPAGQRGAGRSVGARPASQRGAGCWVLEEREAACRAAARYEWSPGVRPGGRPAGLPAGRRAPRARGRPRDTGDVGRGTAGQPVSRSAATPSKAVGSAPASRPASRRSLRRTRTSRHARSGPRPVPQPYERRVRHRTDPARTQHTHLPHR